MTTNTNVNPLCPVTGTGENVTAQEAATPPHHTVLRGPHGPVPYIAKWSSETYDDTPVLQTRRGIAYPNESVFDRDRHGVLWVRMRTSLGHGEPNYRLMHTVRQRRAMLRLLCQVCAQPADQNEQGTLWLLADCRDDWPGWPNRMANFQPPLCLRCARMSIRFCPALQPTFVAVRAHSTIAAVSGVFYRPGHPFPEAVDTLTVPFEDPTVRWILAAHLIRELHDCTLVEL